MSRFWRLYDRWEGGREALPGLGLDAGSYHTRLVQGSQIIYDQRTAIALHLSSDQIVAVGDQAYQLWHKTPPLIKVFFPVQKGIVSDQKLFLLYLRSLWTKLNLVSWHSWQRLIKVGIRTDATQTERSYLEQALNLSQMRRHQIINTSQALTHRLNQHTQSAHMIGVINIGGQITELILMAGGEMVMNRTIEWGGEVLTQAIKDHLHLQHQLDIGWVLAEKIKHQICHVDARSLKAKKMVVRGKNLLNHAPANLTLDSAEILPILLPPIDELVAALNLALSEVPGEMVTDLLENGFLLTGGGSLLPGLAEILTTKLSSLVTLSTTPQLDVVLGL